MVPGPCRGWCWCDGMSRSSVPDDRDQFVVIGGGVSGIAPPPSRLHTEAVDKSILWASVDLTNNRLAK